MQDERGAQQWLSGSVVSVLRNHSSQCTNGLVMSEVLSWTKKSLSGGFGRNKKFLKKRDDNFRGCKFELW